jgi:hypothetical protein
MSGQFFSFFGSSDGLSYCRGSRAMSTRTIWVSEENDRKLWRLIFKHRWSGTCLEPQTYVFSTDQLQLIKKASIEFEEIKPEPAWEPEVRKALGTRRR